MYSKEEFARNFKKLLDERGFTQREMADRINTTQATLSRYVSGDRMPAVETAVDICKVLGVTLDYLFGVELPSDRTMPDVKVLASCYERASAADRKVLWTLFDRYMNPQERLLIQSMMGEEG